MEGASYSIYFMELLYLVADEPLCETVCTTKINAIYIQRERERERDGEREQTRTNIVDEFVL